MIRLHCPGNVLGVDNFERLQRAAERGALVEALREGERDVEAGRTLTHEEMRVKRWLVTGQQGAGDASRPPWRFD